MRARAVALALLGLPLAAAAATPSAAVVVLSPKSDASAPAQEAHRLLVALSRDGALIATRPSLHAGAYLDCLRLAGEARTACVLDVLATNPGTAPQVVLIADGGASNAERRLTCIGAGGRGAHTAQVDMGLALTADPNGKALALKARSAGARCLLAARADAVTARENAAADHRVRSPLVGTWSQELAYGCASDDPNSVDRSWTPRAPLRELVFGADKRFKVAWDPAGGQADYWGTWRTEPGGRLVLTLQDGAHVPGWVDLDGRWDVADDGSLRLRDMWLGDPDEPGCGASFVRTAGRGR